MAMSRSSATISVSGLVISASARTLIRVTLSTEIWAEDKLPSGQSAAGKPATGLARRRL
jgi:hypothetical protein